MCTATWLCCSNMLPLRGEQQATDIYPAKCIIRLVYVTLYKLYGSVFYDESAYKWEK